MAVNASKASSLDTVLLYNASTFSGNSEVEKMPPGIPNLLALNPFHNKKYTHLPICLKKKYLYFL